MTDIILAIIALGLLVTVHETGHFIAARLCGVTVEVFSIGFGKSLLKFRRNDIEYKIGWIPLGGYVKMKGDNFEEDTVQEPDSFYLARWWKKVLIALSGPLANLLFAMLIFITTFMLPGKAEDVRPVVGKVIGNHSRIFVPGDSVVSVNNQPVKGWFQLLGRLENNENNSIKLVRDGNKLDFNLASSDVESFSNEVLPAVSTVIGEVNPGMSAWKAGLQSGDRIVKVDTVTVNDWYKMRELIINSKTDSVALTVQRGDKQFIRLLRLEHSPLTEGKKIIGIIQSMPVRYSQSFSPLDAVTNGFRSTVGFVAVNYLGLYNIITRPETIKSAVGGPLMIYTLSSQSAERGFSTWLLFLAAISLVLMMMNLLPIPILDGGHIMFALVQAVIGRPVPRKVQTALQNVGMVLLVSLMIYAFYSDFTKVFSRAISNMNRP